MSTAWTIIVLALLSHVYFKNNEPRPLQFLSFVIIAGLAIFVTLVAIGYGSFYRKFIFTTSWFVLYLIVLSTSVIVYRISPWHPLASFPGPKLPATTKWWMVHRIILKGGRHLYLQKLHNTLGPFVRVGPNEISVNDPAAVRAIYKLDRAPFYQGKSLGTPAKADSLITVMDRQKHAHRRQAWARAVTGEAMYSYIPLTQRRVKQLLVILQTKSAYSEKVNLDHWMNLFFMDLMGDMGFSGGFETMKAGADTEGWLHMLGMGVMFFSAMGQVPWLKTLMQLLPKPGPLESFHKFTENKVHEIRSTPVKELKQDILSTVLDQRSGSPELSRDEAAADAALVVVGATDTSVQAVLTFFRYICVDQRRQRRLQSEINEIFCDITEEFDIDAVSHLPYLDACFQEALRIMPPGPFGPPRTTGLSGAQILNTWIPPNTTIHVPVYALHRDPANFGPHADDFMPERWLENKEGTSEDRKSLLCNREAFVPFSSGYASCVGKHLAQQNIKVLLAHLLHTFKVVPSSNFNPEAFDASYNEYGLWTHDPLEVQLIPRC